MPQPGSLCGVWDVIVSLVGSRVPWTVLADLMVCNRELLALCTGALQKKEGGTWSVHPLVQVDSFCMHKQAVRCLRIITARAACPRTLGDGYLIVANGMTTWEDFNTSGLMTTTRDHLRYSEDGLGAHRFTEYFVCAPHKAPLDVVDGLTGLSMSQSEDEICHGAAQPLNFAKWCVRFVPAGHFADLNLYVLHTNGRSGCTDAVDRFYGQRIASARGVRLDGAASPSFILNVLAKHMHSQIETISVNMSIPIEWLGRILEHVGPESRLRSLSCNIDSDPSPVPRNVVSLARFSELNRLVLHCCHPTPLSRMLRDMRALETLKLSKCFLEHMDDFKEVLCRGLRNLDLSGCVILNDGLGDDIMWCDAKCELSFLRIDSCRIKDTRFLDNIICFLLRSNTPIRGVAISYCYTLALEHQELDPETFAMLTHEQRVHGFEMRLSRIQITGGPCIVTWRLPFASYGNLVHIEFVANRYWDSQNYGDALAFKQVLLECLKQNSAPQNYKDRRVQLRWQLGVCHLLDQALWSVCFVLGGPSMAETIEALKRSAEHTGDRQQELLVCTSGVGMKIEVKKMLLDPHPNNFQLIMQAVD